MSCQYDTSDVVFSPGLSDTVALVNHTGLLQAASAQDNLG